MKKIISLLICLVMLIPLGITASSETFTPPPLSGTTYTVSTAAHLRWISAVTNGTVSYGSANYPSDPSFSGYTISLKNSITLGTLSQNEDEYILSGGTEWTPIGTKEIPFSGTFEGNEYTVSGMYVNGQNRKYNGFFGIVDGGKVNNLTVKGYVSGEQSTGGIAGKLIGEINGSLFVGRIDGFDITGGIAGEVYGRADAISKINLTVTTCNINTTGGRSTGGIAGYGENTQITSCSGGVNIYSYSQCSAGILGVAGSGVKISCCNSEGVITADGEESYVGGILGSSNDDVSIINSSFSGSAYCSSKEMSLCGGIAGSFSGKIENSFVNGGVYAALYFTEPLPNESSSDETSDSASTDETTSGETSDIASMEETSVADVSSDSSSESEDDASTEEPILEKICISAGISASSEGGVINNCYFSGISECEGLKGFDICPDGDGVTVQNVFYSYGTAYVLYGTDSAYHVVALLDSLKAWVSEHGSDYSSWQSVSGVNDSKPLMKHTNVAGSNGSNAWKVEGTKFTFYTDGAMEDYYENKYGIIDTPWAVYRPSIRTVVVKEGVTRIGNNAFNSFDNLRTLTLPSTLTEIGDYSFDQCVYLKNFTIPDLVSDIGDGAFRRCKSLTKVTLPKGIKAVRKYTFAYCEKLATVSIPDTVSFIGYMAFAMCDGLVQVTLPQSVRDLDSYSFYYCDNLETVTLPSMLNRIGTYAFGRCEKLINFTVPSSATVEANAFWSTMPKGDVDGDGKYTVFDYLKIKAHFMGASKLTNAQIKAADSDFNGVVNATDYLIVKKYILGE